MNNKFYLDDDFSITEANVNTYAEPFVHPRRIMKEYDFIYLLKGSWKLGQDEEEFELKPDSVLILAPNHEHYGISFCDRNTKTMYFHVKMSSKQKEKEIILPSLINASFNSKIKNIFNELITSKQMGKEIKASQYFRLLLLELSDNFEIYTTNDNSVALEIRDIIHKHPDTFYSNEELASLVGVSTKSAEIKFKSYFKTTIHKYTIDYKIKEAISFFKHFPNMTIKEISINLGFFDEYHFSKQFKKITGYSPKKYKNNLYKIAEF